MHLKGENVQTVMFDSRSYDQRAFAEANEKYKFEIRFLEPRLTELTADLANGFPVVCSFVNDQVNETVLKKLQEGGCKLLALRSAGYNHVDIAAAGRLGIQVVRVPSYSPHAVAEHAFALLMTLNRKIHRANARVRELNFTLDGLVGFDLYGKTFGVVGLGKIGWVAAKIAKGFGCKVLATDINADKKEVVAAGIELVEVDELFKNSDIVSLHVPLNPHTYHLVDERRFGLMRAGAILINTSRGGLVDASALIQSLKKARLGGAALDVYEEEEGVFFQNLSEGVLQDDILARLMTFPNVLITAHQAFLTKEALGNIADTTLANIAAFANGKKMEGVVL